MITPIEPADDEAPILDAVLELPTDGTEPYGCVVVCHPHPLYGGDRESSVVRAIADGALTAGLAALRFDFRGVGASDGTYDEGRGERDDARAALAAAAAQPEIDAARVALAGYSFGGGVAAGVVADAIAAKTAEPRALALVASPLTSNEKVRSALISYTQPLLLATGENDGFSSPDTVTALATERTNTGVVTETLTAPGADHFWLGSEQLLADRTSSFFMETIGG